MRDDVRVSPDGGSSDRDGDVLRNLPRSRPQRRSARRGSAQPPESSEPADSGDAKPAAARPAAGRSAAGAKRKPAAKARAARGSSRSGGPRATRPAASSVPDGTPAVTPRPKPKRAAARPAPQGRQTPADRTEPPGGLELVGTVIQAAGELAQVGVAAGIRAVRRAASQIPKP